MIIPIYKPIGASTHQLAASLGKLKGEKSTHTGTLDPMADGVIIGLTGQDRLKKSQYSSWEKTYLFKVLFGISTDSHDLLGKITKLQTPTTTPAKLVEQVSLALNHFQGTFQQQLPDFSAKRIAGSSFMHQAREGKKLPAAYQTVTIFESEVINHDLISLSELRTYCQNTIPLVKGDFRQKQILAQWQTVETPLLPLITIKARTSKKTYIRALVRDLAEQIGIPATAFSITRTQNGPYQIQDCLCLL